MIVAKFSFSATKLWKINTGCWDWMQETVKSTERSWRYAASKLWNAVPDEYRKIQTRTAFQKNWKASNFTGLWVQCGYAPNHFYRFF